MYYLHILEFCSNSRGYNVDTACHFLDVASTSKSGSKVSHRRLKWRRHIDVNGDVASTLIGRCCSMGNFRISATTLVPQWINRRNRCRQYIGKQLWKARQFLWSQRWFDVGPTLVAEVGCRCRPSVNERYHADVGQRRFPMLPRHLPTSGRRHPDLHLLR